MYFLYKNGGITIRTVTKEQIKGIMDNTEYKVLHRIFDKQCVVVAKIYNGFTIVGESACVDPKKYEEDIGYGLALKDIENQLWMLEGYLLQSKLS